MTDISYRPRLSIEIPEDLKRDLDDLLGPWRIRKALFNALLRQIVKRMKKMDKHQRHIFIAAIVDDLVEMEEWSPTIREVTKAGKQQLRMME